ncbi:MAG: hypothetical protein ACI9UK_002138 [Candidatus Krumholzibacteriia bacterium]
MINNKKILMLLVITIIGLTVIGCSDSDTGTAVVLDTAPPAVPANIDMDYNNGNATISWAVNNVDSDLAGYVVVRERYGMSETLVSSPALVNSYVDSNPLTGASMYHVYSVDTSGNQSAVSTTHLTVELGHETGELYN